MVARAEGERNKKLSFNGYKVLILWEEVSRDGRWLHNMNNILSSPEPYI